jgi:lysophospholipase L1-like esterase
VKDAIDRELAKALDAKPRLVTVWLNVNDLIKLVSAPDYERDLERLVKALRQGGQADVLVANTPPVELLPVVRACLPGAPEAGAGAGAVKCPLPVRVPESLIVNQVDAYNQAIARVVQRQGAILVDLHAAGRASWSPSLVAADGFHPSTEGHRKVAEAFAAAVPPALRR